MQTLFLTVHTRIPVVLETQPLPLLCAYLTPTPTPSNSARQVDPAECDYCFSRSSRTADVHLDLKDLAVTSGVACLISNRSLEVLAVASPLV